MTNTWQKQIEIRTAEGVCFPIAIADPITRMVALFIDFCIVQVLSNIIAWPLYILSFISPDVVGALIITLTFILSITYPMFMEWRCQGRTVGKIMLKIRVIDATGLKLKPEQVIVRNLLRFVDAMPILYLVGGTTAFFSLKGQRVGDIAAGTVVTRTPKLDQPDLEHILPEKFNSLRSQPHLVARARQRFSPTEAGLILDALIRRNQFDTDARIACFHDLRTRIEERISFPEDTTLGMSDEVFIRNIADILFR